MKASVDPDVCAGHGACVATCPEVFDINDDGYSHVLLDVIPAAVADRAHQASRQCPEHAITLTDG